MSYIVGAVERFTNLRLKHGSEILVEADFVGNSIEAEMLLDFSLRLWHLLAILLRVGLTYLKQQIRKASRQPDPATSKQTPSSTAPRQERAATEHT